MAEEIAGLIEQGTATLRELEPPADLSSGFGEWLDLNDEAAANARGISAAAEAGDRERIVELAGLAEQNEADATRSPEELGLEECLVEEARAPSSTPLKRGSRFSRNAATPSAKSSVRVAASWSCASSSSCSSSREAAARSNRRFVIAIARVGSAANAAARSCVRASTSSAGTISETSPHASASSAPILRPEHIHSNARA